jgi:mRNA interferase RelE/StbE
MAEYRLTVARSARKDLEKLQTNIADRIVNEIALLASEPRPQGGVKLHGQKNLWRIRVGDYRVIYAIDDAQRWIDISIVRHRRDVYRLM